MRTRPYPTGGPLPLRTWARVRPVDPLLVITNDDAGTADDEAIKAALASDARARARWRCSRPPSRVSSTASCSAPASRRIVVAGGDGSLHAVIAALYRRHDLKDAVVGLLPMGTGNDFARTLEIPLDLAEAARVIVDGEVRPMDLIVDELGEIVVNNVHVGAGAQASRRGARWKDRLGSVGVGQGQPRQARLPDRRRARGVPPAERAHARRGGRRGRHRPRPAGADGRGRQRRERRRRHRAHPGGRPRGRQGRRDDLALDGAVSPSSATPFV